MLNATFRLNRPCFVLVRPGFDVAMIWTGTVETEYVFTVWSVSVDCLWIIPSPVGVIQIIPGFVGEQYLGGVHDAARQAMSVDCAQY